MSNSLIDYIIELSLNPHKLDVFKKNIDMALEGASELSEEDKVILKSRQPERIYTALSGKPQPEGMILVIVAVIVVISDDELVRVKI